MTMFQNLDGGLISVPVLDLRTSQFVAQDVRMGLDAVLTSRWNEVVIEPLYARLQTRVDRPASSAVRHCVHLVTFTGTYDKLAIFACPM
jgi:hypothetical protein